MKRLKYYKTNSQYKLDVMNLFFNWDPDKKNVYLVKEDDHSFYYKGHCDAEYEYTYTEELTPEEVFLMDASGGQSYNKNYLVLTNYAQYFKSFKVNGHELITEEGQEGPLYLNNIFEDSSLVTYNSPNIIQTLNPIEESYVYVSEDGIVTITFDRELTQEDSIVVYNINYGLYIVLSYNPEFNSDYYSTELDINDFITHETGTTVYKFSFNNPKRVTTSIALAFIGVSNKHGLISSMADVIPTTIQYDDTTLTTTLKEVFIPEPLAYNNRNNDDKKIKVTNNTKNIKVRFENPLTDNDSIIMYLFNSSALLPKNEEFEIIGDIVFPNVSTFDLLQETFSTYFTQIDENTYELNLNIIDELCRMYLNIGRLDFNIFGVNKTEAPTSINDFIPCTIIIEETKPLRDGTYYANFEYVDNINDFVNDYNGFFKASDVTKFYKSGFKNLTTTSRYMFYYCPKLEEVEFSNKLVNINGYTFYSVTNLKSINIPSNIKSIGYNNFYNCPNLESVILNNGLESIDSNSFYNCPKLNELHIPKTVTYINNYALRDLPIHFKISVAEGNPVYDSRNNCNGIIETANNGVRWGYLDTDLNAAGVGFLSYAYYYCNFEDGYEFIIPDFLHNNSNEIVLETDSFNSATGIETITYNGIYKNMTVAKHAIYYSSIKHLNAPNTITSFASQACNSSQLETLNTIVSYCGTYSFECSNLKELNITDSFSTTSCSFSGNEIEKLKVNRTNAWGCYGYSILNRNKLRYIETNVDLCADAEVYKGSELKHGVIKCTDDYVMKNGFDLMLGKGWSILDENNGLTFAFRILKDGLWVIGNENVVTIGENTGYYHPDGLYKVYISGITEDTDLNQEIFLNGESIGFAYISDHDKIIFVGDNEALYTTLDFTNEDIYNEHVINTGGTVNNNTPISFVYDPTYGLVYECNPANKWVNAYCDIKVNNLLNGNIIINRLGALYNLTIKTDNYICDFFDHSGNCCGGSYWNSDVSYATTSGIISISQHDIYNTTFKISIPSISGYAVPELPTIETHPCNVTTKLKLIENGEQITSGVTINGVAGTYNSLEEYWEFTYLANTYTSAIMHNGAEVGTIDNLSEETQYVFIGTNNESYKEFNVSATINTTSGTTDYRIANDSNKIKALLVDGVLVEPIDIVTIGETDFADAEEVTYVEGKTLNTSGVETTLEGYELSDYIPVNSSILVIWNNLDLNGNSRICEYNTNLAFVRQLAPSAANRTITLANTTKYIRIGIKTSVKSDVYVTDETNKKYLFRGSNVEFKKYNSEPGEHTITYAFDKLSSTRYLFNGCTSLKTVIFGDNFDTSEVTNMSNMFYGCTGLTSVNFDTLDLSNVITLQGLFNGCSNLTEAGVSNWDIFNVENLRETFKTCNKLNIDVSNWNTSKVTNMNSLFYDCHAITSLDLSNWNTSKVTNMGSMFWGLTGLTSLNISSFNTSNVIDMTNMFRYCSKLTDLDLSNFDTSNVTSMNAMFGDCTKLTSLIMNGSIDKVTNVSEMFRSITTEGIFTYSKDYDYSKIINVLPTSWHRFCPNKEVTNKVVVLVNGTELTSLSTDDVLTVDGVSGTYNNSEKVWEFTYTPTTWYGTIVYNTNSFIIDGSSENILYFFIGSIPNNKVKLTLIVTTTSANQTAKLLGNKNIIQALVIDGILVTPNSSYVFANIGDHTILYILDISKITSLNGLFRDCPLIKSLIFNNLDTTHITNLGYMFYNCTNLVDLDLRCFNTSNVTNMEHMFWTCPKLLAFNINKDTWITSKVTNMKNMFNRCSALTSIDVSGFDVLKVTTMHGMFSRCTNLQSLDLSNFVTTSLTNMEYTFDYCTSLEELDISNFNTSKVTTMLELFINSTNLKKVKMGGDISKVTNVNNMFANITTEGVLEYNCDYDYSKIIAKLPSTWTSSCLE